jgi:hypothetical protein
VLFAVFGLGTTFSPLWVYILINDGAWPWLLSCSSCVSHAFSQQKTVSFWQVWMAGRNTYASQATLESGKVVTDL